MWSTATGKILCTRTRRNIISDDADEENMNQSPKTWYQKKKGISNYLRNYEVYAANSSDNSWMTDFNHNDYSSRSLIISNGIDMKESNT